MSLSSAIEIAGFQDGQPATNWRTLGDVWTKDPQLLENALIKKKKKELPVFLLNKILTGNNCEKIAIRRKLINSNFSENILWSVTCPKTVSISIRDTSFDPLASENLIIIYFINCFVSPYWEIIYIQHLNDLAASGLCSCTRCDIKIVANCKASELTRLANLAEEFLANKFKSLNKKDNQNSCTYSIVWTKEEYFEYPGINLCYETSKTLRKSDYIIYAHAKGLSHLVDESSKCDKDSVTASQMILKNAIVNVDILNTIPSLNKIGPGLGGTGWMWFNFFLSRASYIKNLRKPVRSPIRHDYEGWLGKYPNDIKMLDDGLSLACLPYPEISTCFSAEEMIKQVHDNRNLLEFNLSKSLRRLPIDQLINNHYCNNLGKK